MDHYEILEVSPKASQEIIRAAYKNLMQRYHPDRHPDDKEIEARVLQIRRAYEVLSEPDKRVRYDLERSQQNMAPAGQAPERVVRSISAQEPTSFGTLMLWAFAAVALAIATGYLMRETPQDLSKPTARTDNPARSAAADSSTDMVTLINEVEAIPLIENNGTRTFTGHVLTVPKLHIVIDRSDDLLVLNFVRKHRTDLLQHLRNTLSLIPYETLMRETGEEHLKAYVQDALNEYIRQAPEISPALGGNDSIGGIVKVLLPNSFDLN